ncbi:MAG: hypothetical protein E7324_04805 [Clostridiales bacterium]|nr:hypothetical protein [Clostridiales bacterium]
MILDELSVAEPAEEAFFLPFRFLIDATIEKRTTSNMFGTRYSKGVENMSMTAPTKRMTNKRAMTIKRMKEKTGLPLNRVPTADNFFFMA